MNKILLLILTSGLLFNIGCSSLITRNDIKQCNKYCADLGHKVDRPAKIDGQLCCICK